MPYLMELAEYNRVMLKFSGAVGGGTPLLKFAKECLEGDKIISLKGILNGTTNYILTEMGKKGLNMQEALKEAQIKGYAETDPRYDIEGLDTACKLVILSNWILNKKIALKDINITGINDITKQHVVDAERQGNSIKLIGSAGKSVTVKPKAIPKRHPLCVDGILNAVSFNAELGGEITVVGKGAGGTETACSIIRDLVDIKKALTTRGDIEF
jgi:homoserine dehydrogenase